MPVEISFYRRVSLSHMNDPFSIYMFIRKDVVFHVVPNLRDRYIGASLSIWILRTEVNGVPRDAYDPCWAP
jgi:hypothetical protein